MASPQPTIAVFRTSLLSRSETFIRYQTDAPSRFDKVTIGLERTDGALERDSDVVLYPGAGGAGRWRSRLPIASAHRLRELIKRENLSLIHAHFATDGMFFGSRFVRRGVPLVVTLHGFDITAAPRRGGLRGAVYRARLRHLLRRANAVIAVSSHLARLAVRYGAPAEKVIVHHIGVPVGDWEPDLPVRRQLVAVGRLVEKKGFDVLLEAMRQLDPVGGQVTELVILGDGPMRPELERFAAEHGVPATFRGVCAPHEVRAVMSEKPVVVVPSRVAPNGDEEGLPTVLVEAASLGCPIVASAHSGIPDLIQDKVNGLLVPEGDPVALADALSTMLSDLERAAALGASARATVQIGFDAAQQVALLDKIYEEVLGR